MLPSRPKARQTGVLIRTYQPLCDDTYFTKSLNFMEHYVIFRFSYGFNETKCYSITLDATGGAVGLFPFESALINGRGTIKKRYQKN